MAQPMRDFRKTIAKFSLTSAEQRRKLLSTMDSNSIVAADNLIGPLARPLPGARRRLGNGSTSVGLGGLVDGEQDEDNEDDEDDEDEDEDDDEEEDAEGAEDEARDEEDRDADDGEGVGGVSDKFENSFDSDLVPRRRQQQPNVGRKTKRKQRAQQVVSGRSAASYAARAEESSRPEVDNSESGRLMKVSTIESRSGRRRRRRG